MTSQKIVVVGAGIAGLTAAYRLQQQGHDVTVLEAQDMPGGRMGEREIRGIVYNTGARLLYPFSRPTMALIQELGLTPSLIPIRGLGADCDDGIRKWRIELMPGPRSLFTAGLTTGDRARFLTFATRLLALRWRTDPDDLTTGLAFDNESLASFVQRTLGPRVLTRMIEPVFRGTRSFNPEDISAAFFLTTMPHLVGRSTVFGFAKGMGQLPQTLAGHLTVRYNCRVSSIDITGDRPRITALCDGETVHKQPDLVVCAVEGSLVRSLVQGLSPQDERFFEGVRYNPLDVVHYRLASNVSPAMRLFLRTPDNAIATYQQIPAQPEKGRSAQIYAQLTPEAEVEAQASAAPHAFDQLIQGQMRQLYPDIDRHCVDLHNQRIDRKLPIFYPGYGGTLRAFLDRQAAQRSTVYYCGDYLAQALLTGAVASGDRTARQIHHHWS